MATMSSERLPELEPVPATDQSTVKSTSRGKSSYAQILASSAVIAGSSGLNLAIGMVRTKAMAVMLGPAGFGLMGAFSSIVDLVRNLVEIGINSSGVRQIAESIGSNDSQRIARTVIVLRRAAVVLGLIGAMVLALFSRQIATLTFGDDGHAGAVALLSLALFFRLVADGQGALLQGTRRIGDLAKSGVLGALFGTMLGIPLVYWLGDRGVALSIVAVSGASMATAWWYCRAVKIERPKMTIAQVRQEAAGLLKLGAAFMASGLMMMGAAYVVRIILIRELGLDEAGLYQAAWTLGGLYVGFVLQAMGADFYPRLVGVASDNPECNRLVNEQAHISILLASTGVIATVTFAPFILSLLYSPAFEAASNVLRWVCLGMTLRVITWPMGYIIVAKGERTLLVVTETAWTIVNVGATWLLVKWFGLDGAGVAFFASYVFHGLIIYPIVRRLSGFRWSQENRTSGLIMIMMAIAVTAGFQWMPKLPALAVGTLATLLSGAYSVHAIMRVASPEMRSQRIFRLIDKLRAHS